jgi:hypothetical protein
MKKVVLLTKWKKKREYREGENDRFHKSIQLEVFFFICQFDLLLSPLQLIKKDGVET